MPFKKRVKTLRKQLGMTQQQLADVLGVNRVSVAHWETGLRRPSRMAQNFMERLRKESNAKKKG
jgi:DNA-binding transcriptional regulator YiaG